MKRMMIACAAAAFLSTTAASATTIGATMAHFDDNFMTSVRNAMAAEAKAKGVTIQFEDAQGDIGNQLSQIQNFIAQHVDAIVINTVDASATPQMTKLVAAAHIPLVYVNREPSDKSFPAKVVYVGSDDHVSGVLEGEEIAKRLHYKGNVAIMEGELSNSATLLRTQDIVDVVAKYPGMKVVEKQAADWQRNAAIDLMNNWIVSGEQIDAVAANNDEMAIGAIIALQQAGKDPKQTIIGGIDATADGLDQIAKGNLAVTVFQNAKGQGDGAVDSALDLIAGKPVPEKVWIPFQIVTKANLADFTKK